MRNGKNEIMRNCLFIIATLLMLSGCKTKERVVTVIENHTDTLWQSHTLRDSIYLHDSIYVNQYLKGDTVYVEKSVWHTDIRERVKTDTVYKSRTDSVPVPYPVIKEVEKKLNWWQKTRLRLGEGLIGLICLIGLIQNEKRKV